MSTSKQPASSTPKENTEPLLAEIIEGEVIEAEAVDQPSPPTNRAAIPPLTTATRSTIPPLKSKAVAQSVAAPVAATPNVSSPTPAAVVAPTDKQPPAAPRVATVAAPAPSGIQGPQVTQEVESLSKSHKLGAAGHQQRVVFALLSRTLFEYQSDRITLVLAWLMIPFAIVAGDLIGFAVAAGTGWLLGLVGLGDVLIVLLAALVYIAAWAFRDLSLNAEVALAESDGKLATFKLGRFEEVFQPAAPATMGIFFGAFFGIQHAMLMFTPSHLGLPIQGNFMESLLLTFDNACHGVFLDTFEVYSIHLGERFEHSLYSGTVFYAFRIAFDALAFLIGYMLWKRIWLRRFFSDYPRDERDVSGVMSWITARCGDKNRWPRRYHDELMFLVICKAFVNGEEEFVRQLTGYLPRLQVESKVRELFRGADGTALFQSSNQ